MRESSDGDILFMPIESFNQIDDVKDDALHQIVFHTPLIDPHKLKKIDGVYLPAFFLGVSSLWLYYPNLKRVKYDGNFNHFYLHSFSKFYYYL